MSRKQSVDKKGMRKGPWSKEEDDKLRAYIERYGHWNWLEIPRFAGVSRCGKSCRLRWMNYLRPNMKHGNFTIEEEDLIIRLHNKIGNKWATIALDLPGRSDNEIKNYWNTHLRKQSKQNQNVSKNMHDETLESNEPNPVKDLAKKSELKEEEIEALWASLSSEMSYANNTYESLSSCIELTSSMFSASDSLVSSSDSVQTYDNSYDGNFWTDPFQADYDVSNSTKFSSDTNVFNSLMGSASFHEMPMSDEFLWSTMDLYSEYHSQFI